MDQISEHSGTTKSALYRYFTDRAGLQEALGEWTMEIIVKSLDEATATSARDSLTAMIRAFVRLASDSPNNYRFCDAAVNRFEPEQTGGFFNSIAALMAQRLDLDNDRHQLWAAGAIGFVRAATESWLTDPGDPEDFTITISNWLWASLPAEQGVEE